MTGLAAQPKSCKLAFQVSLTIILESLTVQGPGVQQLCLLMTTWEKCQRSGGGDDDI